MRGGSHALWRWHWLAIEGLQVHVDSSGIMKRKRLDPYGVWAFFYGKGKILLVLMERDSLWWGS